MDRTALLLLLLGVSPQSGKLARPIQGTTRLQKLLFLLEREAGLQTKPGEDFRFEPYRFGPVSKELYDDLTKLENLGFLKSEGVAEAGEVELDEYGLSFEGLMGEEEQESADSFEERGYSLTEKGRHWIEARGFSSETIDSIRRIKGKYGALSLSDLLHSVYTRYPEMTTASEIKDRVLRR